MAYHLLPPPPAPPRAMIPAGVPPMHGSVASSGKAPCPSPPDYPPPQRPRLASQLLPTSVPLDDYYSFVMEAPDIIAVQDVVGAYHKVGMHNGKVIWRAQSAHLGEGAPQREAWIWSDGVHDGMAWSTGFPDDNFTWDTVGVVGWISEDFQHVWIPWDATEVSNCKVTNLVKYLKLQNLRLQQELLNAKAERDAYMDVVDSRVRGRSDPGALESIQKTGWKAKMVALIVAYDMGLWDKCTALITKSLVFIY